MAAPVRALSYLRVLCRAPLAFLWTLFVHYFFIRVKQIAHPKKRYLDALSLWGRGLAWIMGVRIHKVNERTWPVGDVIISNHMGFLDIPVLLTFFPAVFIIKMEMRRVFYFGTALEQQGHVFVEREDKGSRRTAGKGLIKVLKDGDRIVVFPEGMASPTAARLPFAPFSFMAAQRLDKRVEACVIDYLPDRRMLEWDVTRPMLPQLVELFGRRRTDISIEFFPSELIADSAQAAERYHDLIQGRLEAHDRERLEKAAGQAG